MRSLLITTLLIGGCGDDEGGDGADAPLTADAPAGADAPPPPPADAPVTGTMSFFVTSQGSGAAGGNIGGVAMADAQCQFLANAAGAGTRTWRAYLSTASEDARDRIGNGPWYDWNGALVAADVDSLHQDPPESDQILDEIGAVVPVTQHDILTGSNTDGTLRDGATCLDWTSASPSEAAYVGHSDWTSDGDPSDDTWNAQHETPCDPAGMMGTLSAGRFYCFAID
jgi:hypothetical protein